MLICGSDPLNVFHLPIYNLPDRRQVNGIAHHVRITMDIFDSEIGLAKDLYGHHEDKYLSTSRPFLLFATMSKRNAFSSGLPDIEASGSYGLKKGL